MKSNTCPWKCFYEDLLKWMKKWHRDGKCLILCLDAYENVYDAELGRQLTDVGGLLVIKEVVGNFTGQYLGATYFRGKEPIDAI